MADWIFQSVARQYDLPGALKEAPEHDNVLGWRVTKYSALIKAYDTVYVCFGGPRKICPGLYATATILTPPDTIETKAWERKYEAPGVPLPPHVLGVWLKIEQHLAPPVARGDIYRLDVMVDHQFVKARIGTNFRLTPEQARAIKGLIDKPRAIRGPCTGREPIGQRSARRSEIRAQSAGPAAETFMRHTWKS
jgi:hypothetical protein